MNIFEKDINCDEQILNFIVNPNQYISQQIELSINNIKENIISNISFIEFKSFLKSNINEIDSFINEIKNSINSEIEKKNKMYIDLLNKKYNDNYKNEIK